MLYDDLEPVKQKNEQVAGWSSGIKLFQSQLQLKKASLTQPKREQMRKSSSVLAPVIDLKSKRDEDEPSNNSYNSKEQRSSQSSYPISKDFDWKIVNEYDPLWPNDYEKVAKDLKDLREREREREEMETMERRKRAREDRNGRRDRWSPLKPAPPKLDVKPVVSLMPTRKESDEEEEPDEKEKPRMGGVAIAPPPSLQESKPEIIMPLAASSPAANITFAGSAVAAKIMAKYGFKEGQGLGKKEQGMSLALQVEKTSKRGGRIIHEKDIFIPPPPPVAPLFVDPSKPEPSITEILKSPSKVVLLRNMVGPGEVDDDLEPEVKDECNTKYGDVIKVLIFEMPGAPSDEAIRIFVEFKRIESAIKAVVDLNGRFFGGRQVKAGFYLWEKFNSLELLD